VIERRPFGRTGHLSTRVIFGAAALASASEAEAEAVIQLLLDRGVNHIDTAASYGDSERLLGRFMGESRSQFFLATKTDARDGPGARQSLERSLERLQVDHVDLIQLHNLVEEDEWEAAHQDGGALAALVQARDEGLVRFIGVTGHGTRIARMHLRSLDRFDYDSVLFPYNQTMMAMAGYRDDVEALVKRAAELGTALQTIKSVARRRWPGPPEPGGRRLSWYEPLEEPEALGRAVAYVLARDGLFLNSSSDFRLLAPILDAAALVATPPPADELAGDVERLEMTPLFDGAALERM